MNDANHDCADTLPLSCRRQTLLLRLYRLGPFQPPASHRHGAADTLARTPAGHNVPSSLAACYYAQRASAALIVSEATAGFDAGPGLRAGPPGLHSREQVEAWHRVTQAVLLQADGLIFNQLLARRAHFAPCPAARQYAPGRPLRHYSGGQSFLSRTSAAKANLFPSQWPRALNIEEMPYVVAQYERAAINARAADFDGVEIHAAIAICSISSSRPAPTDAPTPMARPGRETGRDYCSRSQRP